MEHQLNLLQHKLKFKSSIVSMASATLLLSDTHEHFITFSFMEKGVDGIQNLIFSFSTEEIKDFKLFLKNKKDLFDLLSVCDSVTLDADNKISLDEFTFLEQTKGLNFENIVPSHLIEYETQLLINDLLQKKRVPLPLKHNSAEEFRMRAIVTALELKECPLIEDFVVLEYDYEYFWFVIKTPHDIDYLYSRIPLTYTNCLMDILFHHNTEHDYVLNHVRENILPKIVESPEEKKHYAIGSVTHHLIDNDFEEVESYKALGVKFMKIKDKNKD